MRSMSDSISKKGKRNTNITSLFFETTLTLAGVGDKTYIKLDNREDYISSRNIQEKTKHQRTEQKVSEKFSEQDSIIHLIKLVYSHRFLSLKQIRLHKDSYLTALDPINYDHTRPCLKMTNILLMLKLIWSTVAPNIDMQVKMF